MKAEWKDGEQLAKIKAAQQRLMSTCPVRTHFAAGFDDARKVRTSRPPPPKPGQNTIFSFSRDLHPAVSRRRGSRLLAVDRGAFLAAIARGHDNLNRIKKFFRVGEEAALRWMRQAEARGELEFIEGKSSWERRKVRLLVDE